MIRIDPEFHSYIPPLSDEERQHLEQNIVADGCLVPLVVWGDVLVDGHNRYEICTRLGIPFQTVQKDFADRESALDWMDAHQLGRRNLTPDAFRLLLGRRYNRLKQSHGGDRKSGKSKGQFDTLIGDAAEKIAKEHGVSDRTVKRAGKFAERVEADPDLKAAVAAGQSASRILREKEAGSKPDQKSLPASAPAQSVVTQAEPGAEEPDSAAPDAAPSDADQNEIGADEAKERRELAKLTDEALIDEVIGLRAENASLRREVEAVKRERDDLKAAVRDLSSDNQGAAISRFKKELVAVKFARDNAQTEVKRMEYRLKKAEERVTELESIGIEIAV